MTYVAKNKKSEYIAKIKDYSQNMLSYELSECKTALDAEIQFGADEKLVKKIKAKMKLIKEVQNGNY